MIKYSRYYILSCSHLSLSQVLDAGRLKEFDAPYILLKNPRGLFSQLVEQTGAVEARRLYEIAREKYHEQRPAIPETDAADDDENSSQQQQQPEISVTPPEADENESTPLLQSAEKSPAKKQSKLPPTGDDEQEPNISSRDVDDVCTSHEQPEDDNKDSVHLLQSETDVEIKPDEKSDSAAPDQGSIST